MKYALLNVLSLFTLLFSSFAVAAPKIAILGDSISTGAASHPALAFDGGLLWQVFNNKVPVTASLNDIPNPERFNLADHLPPPSRLHPARREFNGGIDWVFKIFTHGISSLYLDTEEYSWGYLMGRGMGIAPEDILITAENGSKAIHGPRHADRLLEHDNGQLPEHIFIFYTGNDLCAPALSLMTEVSEFGDDIETTLKYLAINGKANPNGTKIHLLSFISVQQLLQNPEILNKQVKAYGQTMTCKELRHGTLLPKEPTQSLSPEEWYFSQVMPPRPAGLCPTLFAPSQNEEERISAIANRVRGFRSEIQNRMEAWNNWLKTEYPEKNLGVSFIKAPESLQFTAEEIAPDCFHLSAKGQARLAESVLKEITPQKQ